MKLSYLKLFLQIIEAGSLSAAARETGLSSTTVSERLAALEEHYGAALLTRSTRSLSLTAEGEVLVEGARRLLSDAHRLEAAIQSGADAQSRVIRFSAPTDLGETVILPIVDRFLAANPGVSIDAVISDENVDIQRQGMDFAVRDGQAGHSALTSEFLIENKRVVVAAPSYIARRGAPIHPNDLMGHDCLTLRVGPHTNRFWRFRVDGAVIDAPIAPARTANNARLIADWCRQGHGIAIKSIINVAKDLANGDLVEVLQGFAPPEGAFHLVYPSDRTLAPLVTELAAQIASEVQAAERLIAA